MKKLLILIALVPLFLCELLQAQPAVSYQFSSNAGTYTPITDGTIVYSATTIADSSKLSELTFNGSTTGTNEEVEGAGFPIGFDFKYNGIVMNCFAIGSVGCINLGKDIVHSVGNSIGYGFNTGGGYNEPQFSNLIGCMPSSDAFGSLTTQFQYKTTGVSPNRVLTVQFKDLNYNLSIWNFEIVTANLQIKLYEGSNKIEFVFGTYTNDIKLCGLSCGLKGTGTDVHLRQGSFQENVRTTSTQKLTWDKTTYPAPGFTFTFTPPPACAAPTIAPTNLVLKQSSTEVEAHFDPSTDADHYLVVQTTEPTAPTPVNGTLYKQNDIIGNGIVLFWFQDTAFSVTNLEPATTYYYHVYPVNHFCTGGPVYGTEKVLTNSVKMLPQAPASLTIKNVGFDSIVLSGSANATNPQMLVLMTTIPGRSIYGDVEMVGDFGMPSLSMEEGDTTSTGALVIYKGSDFDNKVIRNLRPNTVYHFAAFSLNEADNTCSSLFTQADTLTYGIIPFIMDLSSIPGSDDIFGWVAEGSKTPSTTLDIDRLPAILWNMNPNSNPIINSLTSPWIKMSSAHENRLLFTYNATYYAGRFKNPYNDWGTDSLKFQYSEDGTNFTTFFVIDNNNRDSMLNTNYSALKRIPIGGVKGKTVKIRLYWQTSANPQLVINPLEIEELRPCDYPLNVMVVDSTIEQIKGLVKWDALNEESLWNIRYRQVGSDIWSESIAANSNPFLVTSFMPNSILEVQVQAKCTQENVSLWSKSSPSFQSGYAVPFMEEFNDITKMPLYWESKRGPFSEIVITKELANSDARGWELGIRTLKDRTIKTSLMGSPQAPEQVWFLSPIVDLGKGNVHYQLELDASISKSVSLDDAPTWVSNRLSFDIAISTDGGETFNRANILKTFDSVNNSFLNIGKLSHIVLDLSPYTGNIQIGFFAKSDTSVQTSLWLDNIGIQPTCPSPANVSMTEVEGDQAKLTFENLSEVEEWIVGIRKASEETYVYTTINSNTHIFTDLTPQTDYIVSVSNICSEGDTAAWVNTQFTTRSLEPCNMPTSANATNITRNSATLTWSGEAAQYKIRFKSQAAETWITEMVSSTTFELIALETNTTYEYSIQAVCSQALGDTSEWTPTANFQTLAITCLTPTELASSNIKHTSAHLSWNGSATNYQVGYRIGEINPYTIVNATSNSVDLSGLTPVTAYNVRVRAICAVGDTSTWSSVISFTTVTTPSCDAPTNLSSSGITETSAQLAWEANESNQGWLLRYRASTVTVWDSVKNLSAKTYTLQNLTANTAYLWSVQGACDEGRSSVWATQATFTTQTTGIENEGFAGLRIFEDKGQIHLLNPNAFYIERIEIYNSMGQRMQTHTIRSNENVIINTNLSGTATIVRIYGKETVNNFKIFMK